MDYAHCCKMRTSRDYARRLALVATMIAHLSAGCESKGPTAKPPSGYQGNLPPGNNGSTTLNPPASDAGKRVDATVSSDASVPKNWMHCVNVAAATEPGEGTFNNSVQNPADFSVTRVAVGFSPNCLTPTVVLEMSDGRCPDGQNHRLTIEIDAAAIALQQVSLGEVDLATAHSQGQINVRYERPSGLTPAGVFGTCGGESGVITLSNLPELRRGAIYAGSYQMTLNACAGFEGAPQDVQGTFNAEVAADLSDLCPDSALVP